MMAASHMAVQQLRAAPVCASTSRCGRRSAPPRLCYSPTSFLLATRDRRLPCRSVADSGVSTATATAPTGEPRTVHPPSLPSTAPQPAPQQLDWANFYYPVAFVEDLDKQRPHRIEVLQRALVVWWDPNASAWRVFDDVCPHRLVPLSEGRVNAQGHLECGYHGWEWSGDGRCERIPTGGNHNSRRACVASYPALLGQGMLWVKPTPLPHPHDSDSMRAAVAAQLADLETLPLVPELDEPGWTAQDTWRDLPYDFTTVMENVLDVSHVPWTHHKSVSNRNVIGAFDLSVSSPLGPGGFEGVWATGPRSGQLGAQTTSFVAPGFLVHKLSSQARGFEALTVVYAVPQRPGRSRLLTRICFKVHKAPFLGRITSLVPGWARHLGQHAVLEDDQIFLHIGEPEYVRRRAEGASAQKAYYLASPADTFVAAFRSWLDKYAGGGPFGPCTQDMVALLGPRLSRAELLDRYSQHTEQCATCQAGLRGMRRAAAAAAAITGFAAACALLCIAVALAGVSVAAQAAPPAATGPGASGLLGVAAAAALAVGKFIVGAGSPADQALRSLAWVVTAGLGLAARHQALKFQEKFYKGDYPPQRNTASDP